MTYLRFHALFNVPVLLLLLLVGYPVKWESEELGALGYVLLAVFVFTIPWDNWAAKWGIWGFPREKYWLCLGYLPIEEYAFFLLQALCVMLAMRDILASHPDWLTGQDILVTPWTYLCLGASIVVWLVIALQFVFIRRWVGPRSNYALHLAWFLPVIYLQWLLAFPLFYAHAWLLVLLTFGFGIYYTIADIIAVRGGTWHFDEKQILGWKFCGILPWEEIAFFFLTSLLVAQSYLLFLPSDLR